MRLRVQHDGRVVNFVPEGSDIASPSGELRVAAISRLSSIRRDSSTSADPPASPSAAITLTLAAATALADPPVTGSATLIDAAGVTRFQGSVAGVNAAPDRIVLDLVA
jgi:hypothetical protein